MTGNTFDPNSMLRQFADGQLRASQQSTVQADAFRYYRAALASVEALDGLPDYPSAILGAHIPQDVLTALRRLLEAETGCIVEAGESPYRSDIQAGPLVLYWLRAKFGNVTINAQGLRRATAGEVSP